MSNQEQLPTQSLKESLSKNLVFHTLLETEAQRMQYGQISVNVELKDGKVNLKTLNFVVTKRIRY